MLQSASGKLNLATTIEAREEAHDELTLFGMIKTQFERMIRESERDILSLKTQYSSVIGRIPAAVWERFFSTHNESE